MAEITPAVSWSITLAPPTTQTPAAPKAAAAVSALAARPASGQGLDRAADVAAEELLSRLEHACPA